MKLSKYIILAAAMCMPLVACSSQPDNNTPVSETSSAKAAVETEVTTFETTKETTSSVTTELSETTVTTTEATTFKTTAETTAVATVATTAMETTASTIATTIATTVQSTTAATTQTVYTEKDRAVDKAIEYLQYNPYSRSAMIKKLKLAGFTGEQAEYGADNCKADWYNEAKRSAELHFKISYWSYNNMLKQLVAVDGFTEMEAKNALSLIDVDYTEQAAKAAEYYLNAFSVSKQLLIDKLIFDGFTESQAIAAIPAYKINWNQEALDAAKEYVLSETVTEYQLNIYLTLLKFTPEEIEHAIINCAPYLTE